MIQVAAQRLRRPQNEPLRMVAVLLIQYLKIGITRLGKEHLWQEAGIKNVELPQK